MSETLLTQAIRVTDRGGLDGLASLLHDESCDVDAIEFQPGEGLLMLPFRRQFHEGDERVIYADETKKVVEKSWMRSKVTLRHARGWTKHDDPEIGVYSFNDWAYENGQLSIYFHEALTITVELQALDITVEDLGFDGLARIERYATGSEASSSRVY